MQSLWLEKLKRFKKVSQPIPDTVFQKPLHFIAFGFGIGVVPFAPGTFGTLLAMLLYCLLPPLSFWQYLLFTLLFTLFAIYICDKASRDINLHDHPGMCLDEFPGFFVSMLFAPPGFLYIIIAFLLFRFFDIIKPWPINWLDKHIHGGFGMVLDDVVAGMFVCLLFLLGALL